MLPTPHPHANPTLPPHPAPPGSHPLPPRCPPQNLVDRTDRQKPLGHSTYCCAPRRSPSSPASGCPAASPHQTYPLSPPHGKPLIPSPKRGCKRAAGVGRSGGWRSLHLAPAEDIDPPGQKQAGTLSRRVAVSRLEPERTADSSRPFPETAGVVRAPGSSAGSKCARSRRRGLVLILLPTTASGTKPRRAAIWGRDWTG